MFSTEHLTKADLESFGRGGLPPAEAFRMASHLEDCEECGRLGAERPRTLNDEWAWLRGFVTGRHPDPGLIADCLDRTLEGCLRDEVESHLGMCRQCALDLESLAEYRRREGLLAVPGEPARRLASVRLPLAVAACLLLATVAALLVQRAYRADKKAPGIENPPATAPDRQVASVPAPSRPTASEAPMRFTRVSPAGLKSDLAAVLEGREIAPPEALKELEIDEISERGDLDDPVEVTLASPRRTLIMDERPLFRWRTDRPGYLYVASIVDDRFFPVASSPRQPSTEWRIDKPLRRGGVYIWQVSVFRPDRETEVAQSGMVKFKVVSSRQLAYLRSSRKSLHPGLELGLFYYRSGLMEDAMREIEAWVAGHPERQSILAWRRRIWF